MDNSQQATVLYFGYGSNKDRDMIEHMVGRKEIVGEPGKMIGHDLCIQKLDQVNDKILPTAPSPISARKIVGDAFKGNFELYVTRPNPNGVCYGTIWHLTPEEQKLVHDWELLEFGMQDYFQAVAMDSKENMVNIESHGLLDPTTPVDRVVTGENYETYLVPKADILAVADRTRKEYNERNNQPYVEI